MKKSTFALLFVPFLVLTGCVNKVKKVNIVSMNHSTAEYVTSSEEFEFDAWYNNSNKLYCINIEIKNNTNKNKTFEFSDTYYKDELTGVKFYLTLFPANYNERYPNAHACYMSPNKIVVDKESNDTIGGGSYLYAPEEVHYITFHTVVNNFEFTVSGLERLTL